MKNSGFKLGAGADLYAETKTKELRNLKEIKDICLDRPTSLSQQQDNLI
jgi:hypothetical protein